MVLWRLCQGESFLSKSLRIYAHMPRRGRTTARFVLLCLAGLVLVALVAAAVGAWASTSSAPPAGSAARLTAAAITVGNAAATTCVGIDTCTTPALAGVLAGDALVVIVTEHTTSAGDPSSVAEVTSEGSNPLTLLVSSGCTVHGHGVVAIYGLADVAAQASVTFTVDYAADEYYTIHALDVQGAAASPFETPGAPVCSTAAGTEASASVTTTGPDDLAILGVEVRADEAISASGGDSVVTLEEIGGTDSDSGSMLDALDSGTGSITLNATFASAQWAAAAIAVKPASAPSGLVPGVVSPSSAGIDASQAIELVSTAATGGSGSYAYEWLTGAATCSAGTPIAGATSLAYTTPALPTGTHYYCVEVTDTSTHDVAYTNVAVISVSPTLSVSVSPNAPSIDSGQSIALSANPSGGTGADTFAWFGGMTCTGTVLSTSESYTTPALVSTATYCAAVNDSAYSPVTATATDTVTVSGSPLSVTITPRSPAIDYGQTVSLTANPSGGTGADRYAWYPGTGCTGTVLATTQAFTTPALFTGATYCVAVTDSAYEPTTALATDTVATSSSPLSVSINPNSPSIDSGQTVTLTAQSFGGSGADSYAWYSGTVCSGAVLARTPVYTTSALTANATYCVASTDSAFQPVTATATDTISTGSSPLSVAITPDSPSIATGQSVQLTARPSGGTGADTYAWYAGVSCTGKVLGTNQTYSTPALTAGTSYCVVVTDSAYQPVSSSATAKVTVSASTSTGQGSSFLGALSSYWWLLLALLAAIILILLVAALRRRRREEPESPPSAEMRAAGAVPVVAMVGSSSAEPAASPVPAATVDQGEASSDVLQPLRDETTSVVAAAPPAAGDPSSISAPSAAPLNVGTGVSGSESGGSAGGLVQPPSDGPSPPSAEVPTVAEAASPPPVEPSPLKDPAAEPVIASKPASDPVPSAEPQIVGQTVPGLQSGGSVEEVVQPPADGESPSVSEAPSVVAAPLPQPVERSPLQDSSGNPPLASEPTPNSEGPAPAERVDLPEEHVPSIVGTPPAGQVDPRPTFEPTPGSEPSAEPSAASQPAPPPEPGGSAEGKPPEDDAEPPKTPADWLFKKGSTDDQRNS